jgi:tetratricopeptide (TPR) repeat protein
LLAIDRHPAGNVGRVLRDQGDLSGALAAYRESLAVRQRLAAADPSNAGWQRDLSFCLTQIADALEQGGERAEALGFAEKSLEIDERLAALDPTNITWQNDVAASRAQVARLRN